MIHVHLTVKFRFANITLGSMRREWSFELDVDLPAKRLLDFSERGVTLVVGLS